MDTIARYVEHPYYLRSLTQSGAYPGPTAEEAGRQIAPHVQQPVVAVQNSEMVGGRDSREAYDIPNPQLPPPPRPRGTSANDLYESLDTRDQAIRKGTCTYITEQSQLTCCHVLLLIYLAMVKQTSLSSARSIIGTCPDMCPEKERYRREDTRRLSWFEVDHATYEPGVRREFISMTELLKTFTVM